MRIDLFELETVMDGGDVGGGEPAAAEPAVAEAEAAPVAEETVAPADEPASEGVSMSRAEFEAMLQDELDARLAALYQPQNQPPIPGATPGPMSDQLPEYDPFDPEAAQAYFDAREERMLEKIRETIAPVTQTFEQQQYQAQVEAGEQYAQDIIADALASGDDVTDQGKEAIKPIAEMYMHDAVQRYGQTPRAAEYSLRRAVDSIRSIEKAAAERALAQHQNHLATLAGAPAGEPGTGVVGAVPGQPAKYQNPDELVRKYAPVVRPAA